MTRAWSWVEVQDLRPGMVLISEANIAAGRHTLDVVGWVSHRNDGTVSFGSLAGAENEWRERCHVDERLRWAWITGDWWAPGDGGGDPENVAADLADLVLAVTPHTLGL